MKTFNEYKEDGQLNEGILDGLLNLAKNIAAMFAKPENVQKSVDAVLSKEGDNGVKTIIPKTIKNQTTVFIKMGIEGQAVKDFSISLTKLADLPDAAGLFQITGTTSPEMLKALVGSNVIEDLSKNNVMAIITDKSIIKGKKATMKIVKSILPMGKDYTTAANVVGIVAGIDVDKTLKTLK